MKKLILIGVLLVLLVIFIILRSKDNKAQSGSKSVEKETYISQVVFNAPWGKEPGQFGYYAPGDHGEEGPVVGPDLLSIASNGDFFICDIQNHSIQRFSNQGELILVIPMGKWIDIPADLCIDKELNINILYKHIVPSQVWKYNQNGELLKKYKLFRGGGGNLYYDNQGRLFIASYRPPTVYQFGTISTELSPEQQKATLREGFVGSNNVVLNQGKIFQTKESKLLLVEFDSTIKKTSKSDKEFNLYRLDLYPYGQAGFTGVDNKMNIYTTQGNTIRKYSSAEDLVAEFTIEKEDYVWTSRSMVLDEHGNVYVMSTSKEGLKIIKWSPVKGK